LQFSQLLQACRITAVGAGLLYGAVKSTYLQTFKARRLSQLAPSALLCLAQQP